MVASGRSEYVETSPQQVSASNMLNKLARTFASQVEALKKYPSAGEQTIKIQHVTVNEGGQAIVRNVRQGVGVQQKMETKLLDLVQQMNAGPEPLSHEQTPAAPMQTACSPRLEGLPVSRGEGRGAKKAWLTGHGDMVATLTTQ